MFRKLIFLTALIFIIYLQFAGLSGCTKEYSFEGATAQMPDSLPVIDTIKPVLWFPVCLACDAPEEEEVLKWNISYDTSLLCGKITNSVISSDRTGLTFFGPSACSPDTGLVMTVYTFSDALNTNRSNITSNQVLFQYYDNTTLSDIFISKRDEFTLTIESYEHATGIAKGNFNGKVISKDGSVATIKDGNFTIRI